MLQGLLNISSNDHITNAEVCRKIQAAIGEHDELLALVKKRKLKMVRPRLQVFWFNKDNLTGHSEKKDRKGGKTISKCGQEWTLPAQLGQLKQDKVDIGIFANSFMVSRKPSKVTG